MSHKIKEGQQLIQQKRFEEAEIIFEQLAAYPAERNRALKHLIRVARLLKNNDLVIERLQIYTGEFPEDLENRLNLAHNLSLRGDLISYRDSIKAILDEINEPASFGLAVYRKLIRGIQYACSGSEKENLLNTLLEKVNRAINESTKDSFDLKEFRAELYFARGDLQHMASEVAKLLNTKNESIALESLQQVRQKFTSKNYPDYSAAKIFGIGLSRTATSSLNRALEILGYHAIHWINPHTRLPIDGQDFLLFDAFTDISVSYQFEHLYHSFPNSLFIFTNRNIKSWVKSVSNHYKNHRGISSPKSLQASDSACRFQGIAGFAEAGLYACFDSWEQAGIHFQKRVRHFFADKPADRFLEFRITEGEGWEKLCPFLNKPIPDVEFPNVNQGPKHLNVTNKNNG